MHADHPGLGPVVFLVSLGTTLPMHFRPGRRQPFSSHRAAGDQVLTFPRRDRTHGIDLKPSSREASRRVSATFRTFAFQFERSA